MKRKHPKPLSHPKVEDYFVEGDLVKLARPINKHVRDICRDRVLRITKIKDAHNINLEDAKSSYDVVFGFWSAWQFDLCSEDGTIIEQNPLPSTEKVCNAKIINGWKTSGKKHHEYFWKD